LERYPIIKVPAGCCTRRLPLRHTLIKQLKRLTAAAVHNPTLRRRMIGLLIVYASGTCVLAALLWEMHVEAIASGEKVLSAFAQLTEEQTTRTIQNVDQTLEIVEERLASAKREGATSTEEIRRELQELLASRPYLKSIGVLDREGRVIYRSDGGTTDLNLADRTYFLHQKERPDAGFQLGSPIRARTTTAWLLPATRARQDANGAFDGVIAAWVDPLFFVRVWSVDKAMPDQATALWANDGTILMRSPFDESTMGKTLGNAPIVGQVRRGVSDSTYRIISAVDGQDRLVGYRRLAAYPGFSLTITQPTDRVLAVWWRTAFLAAIGWAFSGAALAWLAVKLTREVIIRSASDDRYRVLFKESPYPMLVADKESLRFLAVNEAAVQQYGWSENEHLAMTIDDHYPPEEISAMQERRSKHGFNTRRTFRGIRHRRKDGSVMDMEMAVRLIDFQGGPPIWQCLRTSEIDSRSSASSWGRKGWKSSGS
jgi:PAS domain S-box-containing protein